MICEVTGMSKGKPTPRWSKFKKRIMNLFSDDIKIQIYCTYYTEVGGQFLFENPRHWITLDKEIIWDFPSHFLEWKHSDVPMPIKYLESGHHGDEGYFRISVLFREYIDTPKEELFDKVFSDDYWGVTDIFKAADARIGIRRLKILREKVKENNAAIKVIDARLKN